MEKEEFEDILSSLLFPMSYSDSNVGKIAYLDFAMRCISAEMDAHYASKRLGRRVVFRADKLGIPSEVNECVVEKLDAEKCHLIELSYHSVDEFPYTELQGKPQNDSEIDGVLHVDLGIAFVREQKRWTFRKEKPKLQLLAVSMKNYPDGMQTDGSSWLYSEGGFMRAEECTDYRLALLYRMMQKRLEIAEGLSVHEITPHTCSMYRSEGRKDPAYLAYKEDILCDEKKWLEEEIEQLKDEIAKLERTWHVRE